MDLHHALTLLLMLARLLVSNNTTEKTIDTYFSQNFCIDDEFPAYLPLLGARFEYFGMRLTVNTTSTLDFLRQVMPFFLAGACDMSEIRHGFVDYSRRYISNEALNRNWVPSNHNGKSYYNYKWGTPQTRTSRLWHHHTMWPDPVIRN